MASLGVITQPSDYSLIRTLPTYWRKLLQGNTRERTSLVLGMVGGNLLPRVEVQLLQDVRHVVFDGVLRDCQFLGDTAVGESLRHKERHLPLAAGEPRGSHGRSLRLLGKRVPNRLFERHR